MNYLDYCSFGSAKELDYDFIYEVERKVFNQSHTKQDFFENIVKMDNRFDYVCRIDDSAVAYISVLVYETTMDILSLFVHENYRRNNLAKHLVKEAINKHIINDKLIVTLEVRVTNFSAISFYEEMGFQKISRRSKYYKDLEDAWVMQLIKE